MEGGGVHIFDSYHFFCFLMSTMRFFFSFLIVPDPFQSFSKISIFACRVWRGGVTFLTIFYRFLFSDVNDAVFFSFLIVPDTFPNFCKIFKIFQFLHVECGVWVYILDLLGLYKTCIYWLRWFRGIVVRSLAHHSNRRGSSPGRDS